MNPRTSRSTRQLTRSAFGIATLSLAAALTPSPARATVQYTISLAHPEAHAFHVTMIVPDVRSPLSIQIPAWNATYMIRDFAWRIQGLRASAPDGKSLDSRKTDPLTWRITGSGAITIHYDTFWNDAGPFAAQLNDDHAFLNLAMLLFYVPDRRNEDVAVHLVDVPSSWRIATSLAQAAPIHAGDTLVKPSGSLEKDPVDFSAPDYDSLVDAPIECSVFHLFHLGNISPPVDVVVHSELWDRAQLEDGLTRIVNYETQLMGGAPYPAYTFIFHIGSGNGGGMEHANSTSIGSGGTLGAIQTAAHEFFHLWNVKRIRPQSLEPIDYTREMPTRALWFAEGVTNTYGVYALVRSGLWSTEQFYADLGVAITTLQSRPARLWQSVEESSLDTWFDRYQIYGQPAFSISYYNKGQLDGLLLDILIRDATDNRRSLDDVMRALNNDFAKKHRFYNDSADIEAVAENVAQTNFKDFFARYVAGTDELPYADTLAKAGLRVSETRNANGDVSFTVSELPDAGPKQRRIREGILHGTTN
jgi:predicted metalloprotease with PDZ domain